MKILDAAGGQVSPLTVPTGRLVWVDSEKGNDSLARRSFLTVPFATLTAAKNGASSGDIIVVLPGTYNENNLVMNGVNWHFLNGAVVQYTGSGAGAAGAAIFDTSSTFTGVSTSSFKVTGNGVFKTTGTNVRGFSLANSGDAVTLEFERAETTGDTINNRGTLSITAVEAKSAGGTAILLSGASESVVNIDRIVSTNAAVSISGDSAACVVRLRAHLIYASGGYALFFSAGTVFIDAFEISTDGALTAINYACASNHRLHLRVRRIVNTLNSASARALSIGSGSANPNAAIHLYGCVLFSKYGSYAISAATAKEVVCVQTCAVKAVTAPASNVNGLVNGFLNANVAGVGDL